MSGTPSQSASLSAILSAGLSDLDLVLSSGQRQALLDYVQLLHKWNRVYNLTAIRDSRDMVTRHLLDSLVVLPYLEGHRCIDVGTGAGLPGIPLAIASPGHSFVLLDSNGKKTRFVRQAVTELGLENVSVEHARVEGYRPAEPFDVVLSRAFASVTDMLNQAGPLCAGHGAILAMKGADPDAELDALPAGYAVQSVEALKVPGLAEARHLICIRHTE